MKQIFLSPDQRRLRAGWRLLLQLAILMTFLLVVGLFWTNIRTTLGLTAAPGLAEAEVLSAVAMTAAVLIARRWLDQRSFASLGLQVDRTAGQELLVGFGIGAVIITLVFLIELTAGWCSIQSNALQTSGVSQAALALAGGLALFLVTGWQEELYFRGYLLQNVEEGWNLPAAVLISSLVFGLAHLTNPNRLTMGAVGTALAGLLMAYGYLRTRRLWLPIGLHTAWNFFEGVVFGFPVSGLAIPHLLELKVSGPELLTGGEFGPEAGLVLLPALFLGAILIWMVPVRESST